MDVMIWRCLSEIHTHIIRWIHNVRNKTRQDQGRTSVSHHVPRLDRPKLGIATGRGFFCVRWPIVFKRDSACVMNRASMNRRSSCEHSSGTRWSRTRNVVGHLLFEQTRHRPLWLSHSLITTSSSVNKTILTSAESIQKTFHRARVLEVCSY